MQNNSAWEADSLPASQGTPLIYATRKFVTGYVTARQMFLS